MHNEIAAMFSAELSDSLNKLEREKTLNDTVIKVKKNSLDTKLIMLQMQELCRTLSISR